MSVKIKAKQLNHRHIGKTVSVQEGPTAYTGKLRMAAAYGFGITVEIQMNSTWTQSLRLALDDDVELR